MKYYYRYEVNNVKSIEEIYKMGDIITNEKTKGNFIVNIK